MVYRKKIFIGMIVMRIIIRLSFLSLLLSIVTVWETFAHSIKNGNIEIIHAWAEPLLNESSRVHAMVSNEGQKSIDLLRIETPNNLQFRLFESGKVVGKITVPAEEIVEFSSEAYTIEIFDLSKPLKLGGQFPAIFHFSGGITIHVIIVIGEYTMVKSKDVME